ncbi:Ig-like domain-containing protein [Cyclobacterium plantarum]|uniref:Ig-like domain-containing protein n=1 Tax=Cyclobacterium plantarum TaxID=2716263 RepID=UPI003F6FE92F
MMQFYQLFMYNKTTITFVFLAGAPLISGNCKKAFAYYLQVDVAKNTLGKELWTAGHEAGDQNEWFLDEGGVEYNSGSANSTISSEVAHTGNYSLKMSINTANGSGHGTRNFRWIEIEDHDDLIFTSYFYFPNRIDLDPNNAWFNLAQTKGVKFASGGAGTGPDQINSPHFALGILVRGGAGSGGANFLSLSDLQKFWGDQPEAFWEAPAEIDLPVRKWVKIQLRIIQDRGDNGRILVWQDDKLIIDTGLRNTLRPEVDTNMFSINAYADKTFPTITNIYLDDVSIHLPGKVEAPIPTLPPSVNIVSPENNSTFSESTEVEIQAQVTSANNTIITKVDFLNGDTIIGTSTNAPYSIKWTKFAAGTYKIKAVASDENEWIGESEELTLHIQPIILEVPEVEPPEPEEQGTTTPDANLPNKNPLINMVLDSSLEVFYNTKSYVRNPIESQLPYNTIKQTRSSNEIRFPSEGYFTDLPIKIPIEIGVYKKITNHNKLDFENYDPLVVKGRKVITVKKEGELLKDDLRILSNKFVYNRNIEELESESIQKIDPPRFYPNPASKNIFVDLGRNAENYKHILIHDMQGKLVNHYFTAYLSGENGKFIIPTYHLKQGMHLIILIDKNNESEGYRILIDRK